MIKIYPSALGGAPLEKHENPKGLSLLQWLEKNVKGYEHDGVQRFIAEQGGKPIPRCEWGQVTPTGNNPIYITVTPQGVGVILGAVIGLALVASAYLILTRKPKVPGSRAQGENLENGGINANTPRPNEVIPEAFGETFRYPDLLLPTYRRFSEWGNENRIPWRVNQTVEVLACLGIGEYDINEVWLGDTRAQDLAGRFDYAIHQPGEPINPDNSFLYEWWHTPDEVGFTAYGGAGLELQGGSGGGPGGDLPSWKPAASVDLYGTRVYSPQSQEPVPFQWSTAMSVRLLTRINVSVTVDNTGVWVGGAYLNSFDSLGVGDSLELVRTSDGVVTAPGSYVIGAVSEKGFRISTAEDSSIISSGYAVVGHDGLEFDIDAFDGNDMYVSPKGFPQWGGFPAGSTLSEDQIEVWASGTGNGGEGWTGPFTVTPAGVECDAVEFDFTFPQGWGHYDDKGRLKDLEGSIQMHIRGAGYDQTHTRTFNGSTPNQIGMTHRVDGLAAGEYEVSCRVNPAPRGSTRYSDKIEWSGLKARMHCKPESYEGVTCISAKLVTGNDIGSGIEDKLRVRTTRRLKPFNSNGTRAATREVMPVFDYVLASVGCDPAAIDYAGLGAVDSYASATGRRFDGVYASPTTVKTVLADVLDVAMSHLTIRNGKISGVVERRHSGAMQGIYPLPNRIISPWQMVSPLIESITTPQPDDPDGVDLEYLDRLTGKMEVYPFRLVGDAGVRATKVSAKGVSNRTQADQIASRIRRRQVHQRASYTLRTEMQGMNVNFMDLIGVQDIIPVWGQASAVLDLSGNVFTISDKVKNPIRCSSVAFSKPDGTITELYEVASIKGRVITLKTSPTITPPNEQGNEPLIAYMGQRDEMMAVIRVVDVEPHSDGTVTIKGFNYDERIFAGE